MKTNRMFFKLTSFSAITFTCIFSGTAESFSPRSTTSVSMNMVEAAFCNYNYSIPIQCQATAIGQLNTGLMIQSTTDLYLLPQQCEFTYLYPNYPFFFLNGHADGKCIPAY